LLELMQVLVFVLKLTYSDFTIKCSFPHKIN